MTSLETQLGSSIERIVILGDNFPAPPIIHALCHTNKYDIHVAHPHSPSTPPHANTTYHRTKLNADALSSLFQVLNPDLVISTHPTTTNKDVIEALVLTGIRRFVPCEFGHDSLNFGIQDRLPAAREKAKNIELLRQESDEDRISWVSIAVGTVLDRGLLSGKLGFDLGWRSATLHGSGKERFPASSSEWIGRIVKAVVHCWDHEEVRNRYLRLAGTVTSMNEVVESLKGAMEEHWTADRGGDIVECVREAEKRIERGFPDAGIFLLERSLLYDETLNITPAFENDDVKKVLGLEDESVSVIVRGVVRDFEQDGRKKAGCGCD